MNAVVEFERQVEECHATAQLLLLRHFDLLSAAEGGVLRLRELILSLAMQGKLVPQDAAEESAELLLARSRALMRAQMQSGQTKAEKPAAALTDDEVAFQLPAGWCWCRLTDTGEYINGSAFKPTDWHIDGLPVIRIQNLSGRSTDFNRAKPDAKKSVLVKAGDILVSWSATLDAFIWKGERGLLNQHIFRVAPAPAVCKEYLYWLLKWAIQDLAQSDHAHGLVMPHINRGPFLAHPIALPPLAEQRRIAERIEELMHLCDALEAKSELEAVQHAKLLDTLFDRLTSSVSPEELAENWQRVSTHFDLLLDRPEAVDALEQTILQLAVRGRLASQDSSDEPASELLERIHAEKGFASSKVGRRRSLSDSAGQMPWNLPAGWQWSCLDDIAISGPTNGLSPRPSEQPTSTRCLTLSATTKGYFKDDCFKYVDVSAEAASQFGLLNGDLLIQRGNSLDYVGVAAIYDGADGAFIYPDLMMRLRLSKLVRAPFVHMMLNSPDGRSYFKRNATGTQGTMPKINQSTVAGAPIPLPPLAEQDRILARAMQLRGLCADLRQRFLEARETQKRGIGAVVEQVLA